MHGQSALSDLMVKNLRVAKAFRENNDRINNIDFSENGETLISSSDDDSIVIYDCQNGTPKRNLNSKKYGVDLINYTHATNTAIHSSTKVDHTIRYLSLHDNKYIRYFVGHTGKVVTLRMSPLDDMFISGSMDHTLRMWDLRTMASQGTMHVGGRPIATFDPEGLIFATGVNSESLKLFDLRSYENGPFISFENLGHKGVEWTGLRVSPDGKMVLISTNSTSLIVVDSFEGKAMHKLTGYQNTTNSPLDAAFSPDSQFIFGGSTDGKIHCWSSETGNKIAVLNAPTDHTGPIQHVQFNPKYLMLASACANMAFWVPQITE